MIIFEHTEVVGWEHAIRGMRNPLNSWSKSDSSYCDGRSEICDTCAYKPTDEYSPCYLVPQSKGKVFVIGKNDLDLMKRLRSSGTDHRKYLRMIVVYVDITAPLYWWKEFDTYKIGTVVNSCSTMHKIADKEFTLDDFSHEHLISVGGSCDSTTELKRKIDVLNFWRARFKETEEARKNYFDYNGYFYAPSKEECWWQMIQLLPSSYNQKRTVMMNYEVLNNIARPGSRKYHKQDEWRIGIMRWIESLPYSKELITGEE